MTDPLKRMANRMVDDTYFLAAPLARFAQSEKLDDAALAVRLGCSPADLTRLRLCRNPDADRFWEDVQTIASHFQINADALAEAVRHGQNLLPASSGEEPPAPRESGFFMAARDDDETEES